MLLVEHDAKWGDPIQKALVRAGYAVDWVRSTLDFDGAIANHRYDFAVLSLDLPEADGTDLLKKLNTNNRRTPVITICAGAGVRERVAILDLGADDFLVKPFDLDELTARIRSILRRMPTDTADTGAAVHGALSLFPLRFAATWGGEPVPLTHREFWVLEVLVRRKNQVLTRAQIEEALYGWGAEVESNAIEVYIHTLRRKFGTSLIHTIRGVGYQIAPVDRLQPPTAPSPQALEPSAQAQDEAPEAPPARAITPLRQIASRQALNPAPRYG
jgi:DNA-binding response OmpR family regulator